MYEALYRKYRPKTFDDVVGQPFITETLKTQVRTGRLSHAYLFIGTRGTGKTTCARILAKAVNCEHPVDGNPCNECDACRGIEDGSVLDVVELDAASNNGVDDVRMLRDEAIFSPTTVRKRVYIIDEVHMLSKPAFNALLKILEEPPAHTVLLLISHNAGMLLPTIRSRCAKLPLQMLDVNTTASLLRRCRPHLNEAMISKVAEMCPQSVGQAIMYADLDAVGMYDSLCKILYSKQKFSLSELLDFCTEAVTTPDSFDLLQELILKFIRENMPQSQDVEALYACWDETNKMFADCQNINMDKKQMLIKLLTKICKVL